MTYLLAVEVIAPWTPVYPKTPIRENEDDMIHIPSTPTADNAYPTFGHDDIFVQTPVDDSKMTYTPSERPQSPVDDTLMTWNGPRSTGGSGNDTLVGQRGQDTLTGNAGNDILKGGLSADTLIGGKGADRFEFDFTSESTKKAFDTIRDFSHTQRDRIDLLTIDANTKVGGNQAFSFIGGSAFHGKAGELRYDAKFGHVYGDTNGDKLPDLDIYIGNHSSIPALVSSDFFL